MQERQRLLSILQALPSTLIWRKPVVKRLSFSKLIDILQNICQLSIIERSENSASWDFDLSVPFLETKGLENHITFISRTYNKFPLNSERPLYDMNNIVLRNLEIDLDDRSAWDTHNDWSPLDITKWHFEKCRFLPTSSYAGPMNFPWRGSFRFFENEFEFQSHGIIGSCLFNFRDGSIVLFQGNDFKRNSIQTSCGLTEASPESYGSGRISFVGNRGISSLGIIQGYSSIAFTGMNRIGQLSLHHLPDNNRAHEVRVYFGPREKIDPDFHYCLQHRELFVTMRRFAALNQDARQINVVDKQLERIEYYLNKEQASPSLLNWRIWIEYWQDRLLYAWRRWSSNFYKSWFRPLLMIILGYMILNAVPKLFITTFYLADWVEFTLRPIGEIAGYEESLRSIVGDDFTDISSSKRNVLSLVGFIQMIWITMWSFAFARSIRR